MAHRIEVSSIIPDTRATVRKRHLESIGFAGRVEDVHLVDVYTVDSSLKDGDLESVASMLTNPVTQQARVDQPLNPDKFQWAIEVGYLPGVTDNVGSTARQGIEDLLGTERKSGVYTSQVTFLSGELSRDEVALITESLANPLIQRIHIKSYGEFQRDRGMGLVVPQVKLGAEFVADIVDILGVGDGELVVIGKQGVANKDRSRRGPLALDLTYMQAIQSYFRERGRNPTDVELESIAQTWSEHCKHTIFANPIDEITDGLYRTFIKAATQRIRAEKGDKDFCVSVFTYNS